MPFICESITNHPLYKKSGCTLIPQFIKIKPLSCPAPIADRYTLKSCFMPAKYRDYATDIQTFRVDRDDIWLVTFPRTGTVWLQEMLWLICNDFNYEKAKAHLGERAILFEKFAVYPNSIVKDNTMVKTGRAQNSPRLITTHLPMTLLPTNLWRVQPKIIYLTRNPKDTAISYFHYYKLMGYPGNLDEFLELFMADMVMNAPFHSHVVDFWNHSKSEQNENILFIHYEEMQENLSDIILKCTTFLGKEIDSDQLHSLTEHLSFTAMKSNPSLQFEDEIKKISTVTKQLNQNYEFLKSGTVNSFTDMMSSAMIDKFDEWSTKQLQDSDFQFKC